MTHFETHDHTSQVPGHWSVVHCATCGCGYLVRYGETPRCGHAAIEKAKGDEGKEKEAIG